MKFLNLLWYSSICFRLNDLVAVSDTTFYYTNFLYSSELELLLQLKWGSVGFYDGKDSQIVASGYLIPNGINVSPDGRSVKPKQGGVITGCYLAHNLQVLVLEVLQRQELCYHMNINSFILRCSQSKRPSHPKEWYLQNCKIILLTWKAPWVRRETFTLGWNVR